MNGALLINKDPGISSFGVIETLQRQLIETTKKKKKDLPKLGHGGTLDPFATGLLVLLVGKGVKLAQYFLGSDKGYEGTLRFGQTTAPGDSTAPVTEETDQIPASLEGLQEWAIKLSAQPYLQTPPMYSAKKKNGKPLYELARAGIEVEREPKLCRLYDFYFESYSPPLAEFSVRCSSGTYIRTLAQDFARMQGSLGVLDRLHRTESGAFHVKNAWTIEKVMEGVRQNIPLEELPCWISFDDLMAEYPRTEATEEEVHGLLQGQQNMLFNLLKRTKPAEVGARNLSSESSEIISIYFRGKLIGIMRKTDSNWGLDRVFTT